MPGCTIRSESKRCACTGLHSLRASIVTKNFNLIFDVICASLTITSHAYINFAAAVIEQVCWNRTLKRHEHCYALHWVSSRTICSCDEVSFDVAVYRNLSWNTTDESLQEVSMSPNS